MSEQAVTETRGLGAAAADSSELGPLPILYAARALLGCAWRTARLLVAGRIRQPSTHDGRRVAFADGSSARVCRETVIEQAATMSPAVLVVCFRLRHVRTERQHALFRTESELNTVLFAGFPGLVSKLWMRHDEHGRYRGFYQWDGADQAVAYVRSLWWALRLVSERGSIRYAVLPGVRRDDVLADPGSLESVNTSPGGWWRPVAG